MPALQDTSGRSILACWSVFNKILSKQISPSATTRWKDSRQPLVSLPLFKSRSVVSLCSQYLKSVKNAKTDIERLQGELDRLKTILNGAQQLFEGPNGPKLQTSQQLRNGLADCFSRLSPLKKQLEEKLDTGKTSSRMHRSGLRSLKWPFEKRDVDSIVQALKEYRDALSAALDVDTAAEVLKISQDFILSKLPVAADAGFDSHAEEHNPRCHPKTRTELLRKIHEWVDSSHGECIFWLQGMAGTGKSTISRTTAEQLAIAGKLGASFFFKRGERDRGHAGLLFNTIASQLVAVKPGIAPFVREAVEADTSIAGKVLKTQFQKLALEPLDKAAQPLGVVEPIVIVLDALDECDERDVRIVINVLSLAKSLVSVKLRIFVTSRYEPPLRLGFGDIKGKYENMVLHEIPKPVIEHDIRVFMCEEFASIKRDHNSLFPEMQLTVDWPGEKIIQDLVHMAVPIFIFATTLCRFVNDKVESNPGGQLKRYWTIRPE